jgi:transcriptional regulator with XRE-family HTH domain
VPSLPAEARLIGRNLKRIRKKAGLTQETVAKDARIAVRHYQKLEAGELNVTISTLVAVARALNQSVADLVADA